tara:strand:- start:4915 stop:6108 length:1194 start_codon:yes stop_codon:yes gene_type:complete
MENYINYILERKKSLFEKDILKFEKEIFEIVKNSSFLIIGGAGSIGSALSIEIFKRRPKLLHVVDLSENNLVELVRNIRSSKGYIEGEFKTFAIDNSSIEFESLLLNNPAYDYVFNLSALKHVRSESDPYTLMRMTTVNILNTIKTIKLLRNRNTKKFFSVSSDKATNPVNFMGASKRIMELFLIEESSRQDISSARFANVAFSDGSLLHGFNQRLLKKQPISAPLDISRYFMTPKESGELCLLSGLLGENRETFFPKLIEEKHLINFSDIAINYLKYHGFDYHICDSEGEARVKSKEFISNKIWPCYFFKSDTTGEKIEEEFYSENEDIDSNKFHSIGVIKNNILEDTTDLNNFLKAIEILKIKKIWSKKEILKLYKMLIPDFNHIETGKYLDDKM